jgi:hypothetical protein
MNLDIMVQHKNLQNRDEKEENRHVSNPKLQNKGKKTHLCHLGCNVVSLHHCKQRLIFYHDPF